MKVTDDDDEFFSSMLPCCQKLLPWISVTGHRHSGSRLYQTTMLELIILRSCCRKDLLQEGGAQRSIHHVRVFFFQAEDGIRDRSPSRGLGDVYKRQNLKGSVDVHWGFSK